jgi:hypothetical protein
VQAEIHSLELKIKSLQISGNQTDDDETDVETFPFDAELAESFVAM